MDDAALRRRLEAIERRQSVTVSLLVVAYVLGGVWLLVEEVEAVSGWTAAIGLTALVVAAAAVGTYRRRQRRR